MSDATLAITILITISVTVAVIAHMLIRNYFVAVPVAAVAASGIFQVVVFIELGYLDPFFLIAFVVGAAYAVLVAAGVGVPFVLVRRRAT